MLKSLKILVESLKIMEWCQLKYHLKWNKLEKYINLSSTIKIQNNKKLNYKTLFREKFKFLLSLITTNEMFFNK